MNDISVLTNMYCDINPTFETLFSADTHKGKQPH